MLKIEDSKEVGPTAESTKSEAPSFIDTYSIAQTLDDIKSGRWKKKPELYVREPGLGFLKQINPDNKVVERNIYLKVDPKSGSIRNEIASIEDYLAWDFYENGEMKKVHSLHYDGSGKKVFESKKEYYESGSIKSKVFIDHVLGKEEKEEFPDTRKK